MSMMIESWADHCSSDEEDLKRIPSASAFANLMEEAEEEEEEEEVEIMEETNVSGNMSCTNGATADDSRSSSQEQTQKTPLPTSPPYTAFINNLSIDIPAENDLARALEELSQKMLSKELRIASVRFIYDNKKHPKKRKSFGYIEVESVEDLKTMLQLDHCEVFGRKVRIDVALHQNNNSNSRKNGYRNNNDYLNNGGSRRSFDNKINNGSNNPSSFKSSSSNNIEFVNVPDDIDGSQFRGGKFSSSSPNLKRQSSSSSQQQENGSSRPSLKLVPRSKPIQRNISNSSQSSIFGGGKARDEKTYDKVKRQQSDASVNSSKSQPQQPERGMSTSSVPDKAKISKDEVVERKKQESAKRLDSGKKMNSKRGKKKGEEDASRFSAEDIIENGKKSAASHDAKKPPPSSEEFLQKNKAKTKKVIVETRNAFAALGFDDDSTDDEN